MHQIELSTTTRVNGRAARLAMLVAIGALLSLSSGLALAAHHAIAETDHHAHACDLCFKLTVSTPVVHESTGCAYDPVEAVRLAGPQSESLPSSCLIHDLNAPPAPPSR